MVMVIILIEVQVSTRIMDILNLLKSASIYNGLLYGIFPNNKFFLIKVTLWASSNMCDPPSISLMGTN